MIKNELINKSIDYILQHLDEDISIGDVAEYCHFSKYHFSRMFRDETGESLYAFIKRLRLDQSAINLKLEKERPITEIGLDYGYSSSNYSTVFKKHRAVSPAEFRKDLDETSIPHPFDQNRSVELLSFEEYDQRIKILELQDLKVIHERYIGNYLELSQNWSGFIEKHQRFITEKTLLLERFYDDPSITHVEQCIYDLCMTVDENCPLGQITIPGGKFAVFTYEGTASGIFAAFQGVFRTWLPNSRFTMTERYGLDIYRTLDLEHRHVVIDLCIPVK